MKTLLAFSTALLLAVLLLPLRGWSELDLLRPPVTRWHWLRSEIVLQPRRTIDYAFTGSSKIVSGIRPERIAETRPGTVAYNFAHFGWGHDADYFVARALLERHDVATLVIELPLPAPGKPHVETVHQVGASELVGEVASAFREVADGSADPKERVIRLSRYAATSLLSFPRHVLERGWAAATGASWEYEPGPMAWERHQGFASLGEKEVDEAFRKRQAESRRPPRRPARDGPAQQLPGPRSEFYLQRIHELARVSGTRLVFLHVPSWAKQTPSRAQHRFYSRFGEVIIADLEKLHVPEYYVDPVHLYRDGTTVLTDDVMRLLSEGTRGSFYNDMYRD